MRHLATTALCLALAACHSQPPTVDPAEPRTLVLLKTGPRTDLDTAARQQVFAGHFANMGRLARQGDLLLAGPYGKQRSDPNLRGVFVLATGDVEVARQLAETDPGVQAGVFVLEYHRLHTNAPLREFLAAELAADDAAKAAGKTPQPGESGRGFVLLTAADGDAAAAALRDEPAVVLFARHDERGAWVVLDAVDLAGAEAIVAAYRDRLGEFRLDEWFASRRLAEFKRPAPAGG
jgi:uncharacterized protein YciI